MTNGRCWIPPPWRASSSPATARTLAGRDAAPALIAVHHLAARDFGPAREALLAATEEHYAVHAYRDAARALRTGLEHWIPGEQDDSRLAVIDRLARCAEMCSEYADAVMLLPELADGHERRGDSRALASTCRRLALAHELRGQWESALTAREAAAVAFLAAGIPAEAAIDRLAMAAHLRSAASFTAALATLSAASADAQAALTHARGETLLTDQPEAAAHELSGAAEMFSRLDLPLQTAQAQRRAAAATARLGDHDRARELLHAAHATAAQLGARCTSSKRSPSTSHRRSPASSIASTIARSRCV